MKNEMKKGHGKKTNEHEKGNEKNGEKRNKKKKNTKTKRKGFEKKRLLTISKVNFECKGGNIAKRKKTQRKETKRVREKAPFDNFQGQFSRQRKEK